MAVVTEPLPELPVFFRIETAAAGTSGHGWAVCEASLEVRLRPDRGAGRAEGFGHFRRTFSENGRIAAFSGLIAAQLVVEQQGGALIVRDTAAAPDLRRPFARLEFRQRAPGRLVAEWTCAPIGTNQPNYTDLHTTAHGHASLSWNGG